MSAGPSVWGPGPARAQSGSWRGSAVEGRRAGSLGRAAGIEVNLQQASPRPKHVTVPGSSLRRRSELRRGGGCLRSFRKNSGSLRKKVMFSQPMTNIQAQPSWLRPLPKSLWRLKEAIPSVQGVAQKELKTVLAPSASSVLHGRSGRRLNGRGPVCGGRGRQCGAGRPAVCPSGNVSS